MWSSLNTWFRITLLIQTNWFHCIFLRDLATSWSNNVSTRSSQPGLLSYYDDVLTCGTQGQGCSASWVLHSTVLHSINLWSWAHRTYCIPYFSLPPTHTSCSRLAAYPLCLSFTPLLDSQSCQAPSASLSLQVLFPLLLPCVLLWRMPSNPLGLSPGTSSSRKPLLVSNPDWHKWHFHMCPSFCHDVYPHEIVVMGLCGPVSLIRLKSA